MTVTSTLTRKDYVLDGVVLTYPYDFKIFSATDLEVKKLSLAGIETTLALTTDYSVTGAGTDIGGNVVLVSAGTAGETLVIRRNIPLTQLTSFRNQRDFFAERHEDAYDRATMQIQQQTEEANRAVLLPVTFTGSASIVDLIPGYALGIAADGLSVVCVPNTGADQTADLADYAMATRGAGLVGYAYAVAYGANTVGKAIKDVMDAATTDAANLAADIANLATLNATNYKVPMRQTVLGGAVDATGAASYLTVGTGLTVNLAATTVPVVVAFAAGFSSLGEVDYVGRVTADTSISSLTANKTLYLYIDRNTSTGALTYGFTELAPVYGYGVTKSTTNLQHTYRIDEGVMYVGNGSTATAVQRVFLGECLTGGSTVTSVITYALMGRYVSEWTATLPAAGSVTTKPCGIGVQDYLVKVEAKNMTTEGAWTPGEVMDGPLCEAPTGWPSLPAISKGCVSVAMVAGATRWVANHRTTGAALPLTNANWSYRVSCQRSW